MRRICRRAARSSVFVARVSVCVIRGRVMDRAGTSIRGKRGCQRDDGI